MAAIDRLIRQINRKQKRAASRGQRRGWSPERQQLAYDQAQKAAVAGADPSVRGQWYDMGRDPNMAAQRGQTQCPRCGYIF